MCSRRRRKNQEGRKETGEQTVTDQSRSDQFLARKGLTIMTRPEGPSSASATRGRVPWLELGGSTLAMCQAVGVFCNLYGQSRQTSIPFAHDGWWQSDLPLLGLLRPAP